LGNKAFLDFVDELEKIEDIELDTFRLGKDKLKIITILPLPEKSQYDIGIPVISPTLSRKKTLAQEIGRYAILS
jgi:type III restriction enzyme